MLIDLHIAPDAVDDLARLAHRIADDLDEAARLPGADAGPLTAVVAELRRFADAAGCAAGRARSADRDVRERFR